jgi:hypothetical protein
MGNNHDVCSSVWSYKEFSIKRVQVYLVNTARLQSYKSISYVAQLYTCVLEVRD